VRQLHVQAGVVQSRARPFETIVLAVLLDQQKMVEPIQWGRTAAMDPQQLWQR
jgi:hypothetical protein